MITAERIKHFGIIDRQEQIDRAHIDIESGVNAGLFMGGINILLLASLMFIPNSGARASWWGIALIVISIPITFGCTFKIYQHNSIVAKALAGYFLINAIIGTWLGDFFPSAMFFIYPPFTPYLLHGLFQGICGTDSINHLKKISTISIDNTLDELSVSNDNREDISYGIKLNQQINRANRNIEAAVRSSLLMAGIVTVFTITSYRIDTSSMGLGSIAWMLGFIIDFLVFSVCITETIGKSSTSALTILLGYSFLSLMTKIPSSLSTGGSLERFQPLFQLTLVLSLYLFYGMYRGIIGTSALNRLKENQTDFYQVLKNSLDRSSEDLSGIVREFDFRQQVKLARIDIKVAVIAGLSIGGISLFSVMFLPYNSVYAVRIGVALLNTITLFGCSYGIYHHHQIAARVMMGSFLFNVALDIYWMNFNLFNIVLMLYFLYGSYKGTIGTSKLKKLKEDIRSQIELIE